MLGQSEQKDTPVHKYFTWVTKLSIMDSCICFKFERGGDPRLTDKSVGGSGEKDVPVHTPAGFIGVLRMGQDIPLTQEISYRKAGQNITQSI